MTYSAQIIAACISGPGASLMWIIGGPDDDALPTGVILPPRNPQPVLGAHAVPVVDELVRIRPAWN